MQHKRPGISKSAWCPMSLVSAWSTAAAVPKYDGARHTRVSRHFCICGADLESWVHCVVHIFYPFWPNWMEGNKGIPACPKYPLLPGLGLAGKPVLSELLYKLVPSTYIIEKIACMWTWKIKNFIFLHFTEYLKIMQEISIKKEVRSLPVSSPPVSSTSVCYKLYFISHQPPFKSH